MCLAQGPQRSDAGEALGLESSTLPLRSLIFTQVSAQLPHYIYILDTTSQFCMHILV